MLTSLRVSGFVTAKTTHTVFINNIEHNYVAAKYRLYDVE